VVPLSQSRQRPRPRVLLAGLRYLRVRAEDQHEESRLSVADAVVSRAKEEARQPLEPGRHSFRLVRKRRNHGLVKGLLCMLVSVLVGAQQLPKPLPASIEGTVVDALTDKPISGVVIRGPRLVASVPPSPPLPGPSPLLALDAGRPTTTTAEDGHFMLENLAPGRANVEFRRGGYALYSSPYTLIAGQHVRGPTIRLFPSAVVSGLVLDQRGAPAVSIRVDVFGYGVGVMAPRELRGLAQTETNDRGEFRIPDLLPGRYMIAFQPRSIPSSAERWSAEDTDFAGLGAVLYPGVDSVKKAEFIDIKYGDDIHLRAVTMAASPRLGSIRINVTNGPGEAGKDVTFWFIGTTSITGQSGISSRSIQPLAGSKSCDRNPPPCTGQLRTTHLDAGGNALRTYWPTMPGLFEAGVRWADFDGKEVELIESIEFTGENVDVPMVVARPDGRLEIRALTEEQDDTTAPSPTGGVRICRKGFACSSFSTESADIIDGRATLNNLVPGEYEFIVLNGPTDFYVKSATQGTRNVLIERFTVSSDAPPVELHFRRGPAILSGKVADNKGRVVSNALVALLPESPLEESKLVSLTRSTRSDQDGLFEMNRIIPGRYRLYSWSDVSDVAHLDPQFLTRFKDRGVLVDLAENGHVSMNLMVLADAK
jgi:Carboxypeptidase regulatory-like domain